MKAKTAGAMRYAYCALHGALMPLRYLPIIVATVMVAFAPVPAFAAKDIAATYSEATHLLEPYLVLAGRKEKDARSKSGRADITRALALLTRVVAARPDYWPSYWFIGKAHQALREHAEAYTAFKQALALKPPNRNVAREFLIEAICVKKPSEAVTAARDVANAHPSDAGLQANLGLALLADGQLAEARTATERALKMAPSDTITQALLDEISRVQNGGKPSDYCPP